MVQKRTLYIVVAISLVLTALSLGLGYFVGGNQSRGDSVKQYILTEDVSRGHSLKGKYKEELVPRHLSTNPDNLIINQKDIEECVAAIDLYRNNPITKSVVTVEENLNRNLMFAMPITLEGAIGNNVTSNDVVAIKVKYKDNRADSVVVPSIPIKDITTANGTPIVDSSTVPGFLIFDVTNEESSELSAASKEGSLYIVKYNDLTQPRLEKDYVPFQGATEGN